jgi:hypothetical protein
VIRVVVVIAGALLTFIVRTNEIISSSIADVIDNANEGFDEFREDVEDEIDDHTDSK